MPFVAGTPESFINRNDSLNPNSTCRGITSNGRPCRRPITGPPTPRKKKQLLDPSDETLYCWQHQDQAALHSAQSSPGPRRTNGPILEERTSIDTLADRLGLVELQTKPGKGRTPTEKLQNGSGPYKTRPSNNKPKERRLNLCCFSVPIEEVEDEHDEKAQVRPKPKPVQSTVAGASPSPAKGRKTSQPPSATSSKQKLNASNLSTASPSKSSYRSRKSTASQTAQIKNLIPDTVDTLTASALMTELAKPYVESEEPGYIYMFWLTPSSENDKSGPPVAAARSLLAPPSPAGGKTRSRRSSDVISSFAAKSKGTAHKTILLKIGRAANVQRRMNQWQRQCGYDVEMLRYYPFVAKGQGAGAPRQTPHVKRVERLIHIEMAGMGMRAELETCDACGSNHREWFEADASRDGIRRVDEIIRRWVDWDEQQP